MKQIIAFFVFLEILLSAFALSESQIVYRQPDYNDPEVQEETKGNYEKQLAELYIKEEDQNKRLESQDRLKKENWIDQEYYDKYKSCGMTINYIKKYAEDPNEYIKAFDTVWGDLVLAEKELVFDTLTPGQARQVHYPELDATSVYYVAGSGERYHSIDWCYTLLQSNREDIQTASQEQAESLGLAPCSKCVPASIVHQ